MTQKIYSFFIGRWQCVPPHEGHRKLIQTVLDEGKNVCIAIRDTKMSEKDPYTVKARKKALRKMFPNKEVVKIITIPDIEEVCYGRGVGWGMREIKLDDKTQSISGTKIRDGQK